ncbi:MAG: ATP-binding cassette domain-containing protein [Vicinamibacterales bacterium]
MIAFGWVTNMLQRGMASWKRMLEVLDDAARRFAATGSADGRRRRSVVTIEFRHLTFGFGGAPVLTRRVARAFLPARRRRIVGVTGAGKSTLLSLLARLHEPPPGTVLVDGIDVRAVPLTRAARRDRLRAAGAVPLLRHHRPRTSHSVSASAGTGGQPIRSRRMSGAGASHRAAAAISRLDKDVVRFPERAMTRTSANAASRCRAARSSARRWRARCFDPRSSCSTMRCQRSTPTPRGDSLAAAQRDARSARPSSCRTASRRFAMPTRSSS